MAKKKKPSADEHLHEAEKAHEKAVDQEAMETAAEDHKQSSESVHEEKGEFQGSDHPKFHKFKGERK